MLIVTRRLILSSLLLTALVGSGFLFGSSTLSRDAIESAANFGENKAKIAEIDADAVSGRAQAKTDGGLRWVFFSFGRKGSR